MSATRAPSPATTIAAVGLMLFSMFFGAGNLIFPPMLGLEAGTNFWPAIIGFLATGVLLPILTVIAVAISGSGVRDLASRAGAVFGLVFALVVYLSIGAFYGVPRAAAIGYELGLESTFHLDGPWWRLTGTTVFFAVAYALTLWPGKIVDTVGKILTPALLVLLIVLAISAVRTLRTPVQAPSGDYTEGPFIAGILQGYFTMDSIAALAFALIVVSSFSHRGVGSHRSMVKVTMSAAAIAGVFLLLVYLALGYVGMTMPHDREYSDGAALLSDAALLTLGTTGEAVFSLIVLLACLTTVIGLTASTSTFFHDILPSISYRWWATILSLVGLLLANLGLERILAVSGPIIGLIYPPAIALIAMTFVHLLWRRIQMPMAYRTAVFVAFLFSLLDFAASLDAPVTPLVDATSAIPLASQGMGWLVPTIVLTAIAVLADVKRALPAADAASTDDNATVATDSGEATAAHSASEPSPRD